MDEPLLWIGTLACALGACVGLLAGPRARALALAGALVLAPVLVVGDSWDSGRIADLRDSPAALAAGFAVGALALAGAALVLRRRPWILAPVLIAAMPFRVPVDLGSGEDVNLLLPLYFVIAAGVLSSILAPREDRPVDRGPLLGHFGTVLAAFLAIYALQLGLADDLSVGARNVAFFLVPFAAMFVLLRDTEWDGPAVRAVAWVLVAEGLLFAVVAGFQFATGELFWNDKVIEGNEAHPYFRVNSLFWDPNILGRYLAVTMVALAAIVAWGRDRRLVLAAAAVFGLLLLALVASFSQSSTIALVGGVLVLIAARWSLATGVAAGVAALVLMGASLALIGGDGLSDESGGRSSLVEGGIEIGEDAPLVGTGSGSFAEEFEERFGTEEGFAVESHNEPVTVFAEQGLIGLLAFAALLAVTVGGLLAATGLRLTEPARGSPLAAALLAAYAAMIVHSLGYAAFLTDPLTWAILAVGAGALVTARSPGREPVPDPAPG